MTTIHRTTRHTVMATTVGVLLLAACGSAGTSSKVDSSTTRPTSTAVETSVAPETTAAAADTTAASVAATTAPVAAAPVTVDAATEQALKDADALLASNDQDMASASSAAANGG